MATVDRAAEARRSRLRLYPVSVLYTAFALAVAGLAIRSGRPGRAALSFASGVAIWTRIPADIRRALHAPARGVAAEAHGGPGSRAA